MTPRPLPALSAQGHVLATQRGGLGLITLNRPQALHALSLAMVRDLDAVLRHWAEDDSVHSVLLHGAAREGKPPTFCAGGDIRYFHQAMLADAAELGDFFTEEYRLDHRIHRYPKPVIAWLEGICMGGGMGLAQGAALRVVTEHSKLAMPETKIGLFPDVGGGWFLSRCPGRTGEALALSGEVLGPGEAIAVGLADSLRPAAELENLIEALASPGVHRGDEALALARAATEAVPPSSLFGGATQAAIDAHFGRPTVGDILASLAQDEAAWAQALLATLRQRSPLMMAVALEQVRRARSMTLADELRMERAMVQQAFAPVGGGHREAQEGIRALAIDKDHAPRWQPARLEDVTPEQVAAFFASPWSADTHPLRDLA